MMFTYQIICQGLFVPSNSSSKSHYMFLLEHIFYTLYFVRNKMKYEICTIWILFKFFTKAKKRLIWFTAFPRVCLKIATVQTYENNLKTMKNFQNYELNTNNDFYDQMAKFGIKRKDITRTNTKIILIHPCKMNTWYFRGN